MILRTLGVVALASLTLAGCAADYPITSNTPPAAEQAAAVVADPTAVTIPAIGAHSSLVALGLNPDGSMAVPPVDQPEQASWYAGERPDVDGDEWQPGEVGPAVIAGHVDGTGPDGRKGYPGVFARLHELAPGAEIVVDRDNAGPLTFVVDRVERHDKDALDPNAETYDPALVDAVYGPTDRPELRLVTCGGVFDRAAGHYTDNVLIFAHLA